MTNVPECNVHLLLCPSYSLLRILEAQLFTSVKMQFKKKPLNIIVLFFFYHCMLVANVPVRNVSNILFCVYHLLLLLWWYISN